MDLEELAQVSERLETEGASKAVSWAVAHFPQRLVLTASFQDSVLIDVAVQVDPAIRVVFLDTGFHFPETLAYAEAVRRRYGLRLDIVGPGPDATPWPCGSEQCCRYRKMLPLQRILDDAGAWITGIRRAEAPTRAEAGMVAFDHDRRVVKVNPLAGWTDADVEQYQVDHDLLVHPLVAKGYRSIGCAPTTVPVLPGDDARSGRWRGSAKTECGLHV